MVREKILLIAFFYSLPFWTRKISARIIRKLCIYAYYDIRNLIEIRGLAVKTIALPLDH